MVPCPSPPQVEDLNIKPLDILNKEVKKETVELNEYSHTSKNRPTFTRQFIKLADSVAAPKQCEVPKSALV